MVGPVYWDRPPCSSPSVAPSGEKSHSGVCWGTWCTHDSPGSASESPSESPVWAHVAHPGSTRVGAACLGKYQSWLPCPGARGALWVLHPARMHVVLWVGLRLWCGGLSGRRALSLRQEGHTAPGRVHLICMDSGDFLSVGVCI